MRCGSLPMQNAGFTLREWASNDREILNTFDSSAAYETTKFLGLVFDPCRDNLFIKDATLNELPSAKRSVVSSVSSIFDPLGFLAPSLLEPKLFMRKLCQAKFSTCDEPFNEDFRKEWLAFSSQFNYSVCK